MMWEMSVRWTSGWFVGLVVCSIVLAGRESGAPVGPGMSRTDGVARLLYVPCTGESLHRAAVLSEDGRAVWSTRSDGTFAPLEVAVGDTPPGFTTDVALPPEGLDKTATYIAVVNDQNVDSGTPFTVNELRADRVADYGGSSTRDEFIRRAQQECNHTFLGFDGSTLWVNPIVSRSIPIVFGVAVGASVTAVVLQGRRSRRAQGGEAAQDS